MQIDPKYAFDYAIMKKLLSADYKADNFAGKYMFMGCYIPEGYSVLQLAFKNINYRDYIYLNAPIGAESDRSTSYKIA